MTDLPVLLGIECGGTRTVAIAADAAMRPIARIEAGPANLRLLTDEQLAERFRGLRAQLPWPDAIGVGMAGARDAADRARVGAAVEAVWPGIPHRIDHDLESALAAAELDEKGDRPAARVVVLSGTGSCCYGKNAAGMTAKVGGWGHLLGDRGSAHDIAFRALRAAVRSFDHGQVWCRFGQRALRTIGAATPDALIAWLQSASKTEVAALAPEVFSAAAEGDRVARTVLSETSGILADDALACAGRLAGKRSAVAFVLTGSVLLRQPRFAGEVAKRIRAARPGSTVAPMAKESAWGAVAMALAAHRQGMATAATPRPSPGPTDAAQARPEIPSSRAMSPTERRNPRSMKLDRMPLSGALELMWSEEETVPAALRTQRKPVERLVRHVADAFAAGGRLFYVGAGTSGRLGVLDASECPPTFRTSPEQVQGIMAGGVKALHSAVEGAEDDLAAGAEAVRFRGVDEHDVVLGIAASGRTPFVWGALAEAKRRGARTALLCFNPHLVFARGHRPDVVIAPDLGPEVLTGSTRLKAGTATKLVLNAVTTLAMVRSGKVVGNLMVDLNPSNVKLRDRAVRIVSELTGADPATAKESLERHRWIVAEAAAALRVAGRGRKVRTARKSSLPMSRRYRL